jgi:hypothetical protein
MGSVKPRENMIGNVGVPVAAASEHSSSVHADRTIESEDRSRQVTVANHAIVVER